MAKRSLDKCKSGKDILNYVEQYDDVEIKSGKGSHWKVYNDDGMCVVPNHNRDLPRGTRFSILKTLAKMGIMVLIIGAVLMQFGIL